MPLKTGNTFLIPNTGGSYNPAGGHLFVCVVARTPEQNAVIVPVITYHEMADPACMLDVGDHIFIKHPSCIDYSFARVIATDDLEADLAAGLIKSRQTLSTSVLARVQVGFVQSDELEPRVYNAAHGDVLTEVLKRKGLL